MAKYPCVQVFRLKQWYGSNEIESAKSIADLKTSHTVTGAKYQTYYQVLDSKKTSGVKKIINETAKEESSLKKNLHKKRNAFPQEGKSYG